jgi:hypothetical protein
MALCSPPGAIFSSGKTRQAFGELVERIVQQHYCADLALHGLGVCAPFIPPSLGGARAEFFDEDAGVTRCALMANYLKFHNSAINEQAIVTACQASHPKPLLVKVPDIISHRFARTEFYEVKPNSASGILSGTEKIAWFNVHCRPPALLPQLLPYTAGRQDTPDFTHILADGSAFGLTFRVGIHIFRPAAVPALILYELCPTTSGPRQEKCAAPLVRLPISPLQGAVGRPSAAGPAPNLASDVEYVQALLNDWRGRRGQPLIDEDGIWVFHGETDGAIVAAQQEVFGGSFDGRIDVNGATIGQLEEGQMRGMFAATERAISEASLPPVEGAVIFHDPDEERDDDRDEGINEAVLIEGLQEDMQDYLLLLYPHA